MAILETNVSLPSRVQSAQITIIQNLVPLITAVALSATEQIFLKVITANYKSEIMKK